MKRLFIIVSVLFCAALYGDSVEYVPSNHSWHNVATDAKIHFNQPVKNHHTIVAPNPITISTHHQSYTHHTSAPQHNLSTMNTEQLARYFSTQGYTEGEILSQPMLYMNTAYLALARQLPRYSEYVQKYYKDFKAYSRLFKLWEMAHFRYCKGLTKRFKQLHQECIKEQCTKEALERKQHEDDVQKEHANRLKKEAEAREAYISELKRVETILNDDSSYKRVPSSIHKARREKIKIAQQQPERKLRKLHTDQEAINFAAAYGITEQQVTYAVLNSYEYQLHKEFISHIHSTTALQRKHAITEQNIFIDALGNGIALGMKSNHLHNLEWATRWSNFCYEATEIVRGIGEGIVLGSYNTVDMIMHPVRTLVRVVDGIHMLGSLTTRTIGTLAHWDYLIEHGECLQCVTEMNAVGEQLISVAANIKDATSHMSNREIAKHVTAFGTEWALTGQMFAIGHTLCANLGQTIKRTIKFLKDEGAAGEFALATTDGMLLKASENMNKGGSSTNSVIRNSNTILETIQAQYMATIESELKALRLVCDNKVSDAARFGNKYLKPEYEHILGMDLYFSRRGIPKLGGFHHDLMQTVEKTDIFKFIDKVVHENGCYSAKIYYGEHLVKDSTFFPAHWSREQVIEKIYEAYNNFVKSGVKAELESGKYYIKSTTNEGICIEMYITTNGHIKTAYPTF